ncbi:hypothetical protein HHL25_02965 [Rhizobium sp. S-51]|uniref:Uncharacterized protein n=1 Tax=Rhizobium terricola TaxID=2728849 RepID=A0A7Y0FUP8_9HYPH|nr:hypothetical protein [Rhizobium terricola]NML73080.1 hypothetical protein [Rhizobium terricola]
MVERANTIWADGPSGSPEQPEKSRIRAWGTWLESAVAIGRWFATRAEAAAEAAFLGDGAVVAVYADPTGTNNGLYKIASHALVKISDFLPGWQVVRLAPSVGSTANAWRFTATPFAPVTDAAVLFFGIAPVTNTSSSVTVSFDGGVTTHAIKTAAGNNPPVGALVAGLPFIAEVAESGTQFRLLSDFASPAVQAASEAALSTMLARVVGNFASDAACDSYLTGSGLTKIAGTIYFNTTSSAWKYWDSSSWQTIPYATVADGSVTEIKLSSGVLSSPAGMPINGLLLSNNAGAPNSAIDISSGKARAVDRTLDIVHNSGWTKTTGLFSIGSGNGMMDAAVQASKVYHVHLIWNPTTGARDFLASTSPTAPTMPSGYTKRRRISTFMTDGSGNIRAGQWRQDGSFQLAQPLVVALTRALDVLSLLTLPVPLGIKIEAHVQIVLFNGGGTDAGFYGIVRDPDTGAPVNDANLGQYGLGWRNAGNTYAGRIAEWTSAAGQVYTGSYPASANNKMHVYLQGWRDLRDEFV